MDLINSLAEIVVVAFLIGAMVGAIVAAHLQNRKSHDPVDHHVDDAMKVKVKANRRDYL